jgi:two-component system CheB/CheR fusion protein
MSSNEDPSVHGEDVDGLPSVAPDRIEQDFPETLDDIVPTRGYEMAPMVGLGGSAGSISALVEFFKEMPADSGLVFVVILHLSPNHESTLAALLGRSTSMPVIQATDGAKALPNHVYVIPPGKYLTAIDGRLALFDLEAERGRRVAVDMFFRSLADTHGAHAMAVVLSGADGDGALGIKRVKERGGLTIAQDPSEAEQSGMPRSAINTGMVDWVLLVREIPARLLAYVESGSRIQLPPEDGPPLPVVTARAASDDNEAALRDVIVFLRTRTGRDFSGYKRATILRRLGRRMQVNAVDELPDYLVYLRTHPGEAGALLQDLLISVTNFFRDREAFDAMQPVVHELFRGKSSSDAIRIWVPACATGEEAYSFAIMLLEHAATLDSPPALQVFACDLNDEAIQAARAGHYPSTIEADVSEERLRRFFVKDHSGYRVRRELREMVLFASHDLLKDAPFSRMDLISCRNLLIYLGREAQQRLFEIFHFALKPDGKLFLGSSESIEDGSPLYRTIDKKHRIYASVGTSRASVPVPLGPSTLVRAMHALEHERQSPTVVHGKPFSMDPPSAFDALRNQLERELDRDALSELHFKLVEKYAPPSLLINAEHDVVHLSEHAGRFLKLTGGEPSVNLMRMVSPELRGELRAALFRATESGETVQSFGIQVEIEGRPCSVDLRVSPAPDVSTGFLLVVFELHEPNSEPAGPTATPTAPDATRHLEREIDQVRSHLRDTVEQYEASTEELKASNEELQAMNEELRSATEELETSREELQSINEELSTVNQEMKSRMDEIASANSDLQNLMASTSIVTVFLDRGLTIMRYTPNAAALFNMIPGDVGRPLAHLKHRLEYPDLIADAERVLRTLVPIEREVSAGDQIFLVRLQPYRTLEDHIAGAVLTLVDVTERNRATEALRRSEERMRLVIESAKDYAIFTVSLDRRVDTWNSGAETMFRYSESEIVGQLAAILFTPEDRARGDADRELDKARDTGRAENERYHARKDGSIFYGSGSVMALREPDGTLRGYVKIMRDLSESKRSQEALRQHLEELTRFNAAAVGRESRMIELKNEINQLCQRLGEKPRYVASDEQGEPA